MTTPTNKLPLTPWAFYEHVVYAVTKLNESSELRLYTAATASGSLDFNTVNKEATNAIEQSVSG